MPTFVTNRFEIIPSNLLREKKKKKKKKHITVGNTPVS
mgnify:CR=1 FL=1